MFLCTISDWRRNVKLATLCSSMLAFARAYIEYRLPDHCEEICGSLDIAIKNKLLYSTIIDQKSAITLWNEEMVHFAFCYCRPVCEDPTIDPVEIYLQTKIRLLPCTTAPGDFVTQLKTRGPGNMSWSILEHEVVLRQVDASDVLNTKLVLDLALDRNRHRSWDQDRMFVHLIGVLAHSLPSDNPGLHTEIVII